MRVAVSGGAEEEIQVSKSRKQTRVRVPTAVSAETVCGNGIYFGGCHSSSASLPPSPHLDSIPFSPGHHTTSSKPLLADSRILSEQYTVGRIVWSVPSSGFLFPPTPIPQLVHLQQSTTAQYLRATSPSTSVLCWSPAELRSDLVSQFIFVPVLPDST